MKTLAHAGDKADILRRLKTVGPESSRHWGRMSAPQMVCHLSDSFRMCLGQKEVRPTNSWLGHTIVKPVALYLPIPWLRGIHTSPELNQECGGTKPTDFAADGAMSDAAWLRWG
jgi:hypothetical protein